MAVILPSVYKDGTATVNNGATTVTGQNTLFINSVLPGDFFGSSQGVWVRIASVDSNTTLTLSHPWPEATQTAAPYEIMLQSDNARMQETSRQLLQTLSSGNAYSLSQLNGSVDQIPIFSGPGVFTLLPKSELLSKEIYDPNNRQSDAFLYDNQTYAGRGCAHVGEGDSLTYGFGVPDPSTQSYFAIYGNQKFTEGASLKINFAVSGSTLYSGGPNPSITDRYAANVRPCRPTPNGGFGGPRSYLYVTGGTNDIIHGRTAAQIITDLTNYVATAKADGFTVIVGTITPSTAWNPEQNDRRLAVNAAIRKGAVGANIVWGMDEVINNPADTSICPDGGHYSVLGNFLLGYYLDEGMRGGFRVKQTYGVSDSGRPVDPAWELIASTAAPGGTTSLSWTGLDAYRYLKLRYDILPSDGCIIGARTSRNNGATWDAGSTDYTYHGWFEMSGAYNNIATNNIASLPLVAAAMGGNVAEGSLEIAPFNKPNLGTYRAVSRFWNQSPVSHRSDTLDGYIGVGGARNAIMFYALVGNFSGNIVLEGIRG
jgi:lysophospholipase L1-like esterase